MKIINFLTIIFLLAVCFNNTNGQSKEPSPEHKKLIALVGSWTIQGMEESFLEICEMYEGNYFLVCNSEFKTKSGAVNKGVSIIGFSIEDNHLTYYHYGSSGESQTLKGNTDEEGNFLYEGEEVLKGKLTKTRVAINKAGENFNFKEEISIDNGPWTTSTEMVLVRLK